MMINTERSIEEIEKLRPYLPEKNKEELEQILAYGEEMKAEGERKKQEFWKDHVREDFMKLLRYNRRNKEEIEGQYKYLDIIKGLEREKFIEEYLHDDILYSGELDETEVKEKTYYYNDWKEGNVVMEDGVVLYLNRNKLGAESLEVVSKIKLKEGVGLYLNSIQIGDEGAKTIAKNMKLKEGVALNLGDNEIGAKGAKAIADKMELHERVGLNLYENQIGDEGAEAISKMKLKDGVILILRNNGIGAEGAKAIVENMKLKEGVWLSLYENQIGDEGAKVISNMELKEGVTLDLRINEIGDEGAEALIHNMELKDGVELSLAGNEISEGMKKKLKEWEKSYNDRGIKCIVVV